MLAYVGDGSIELEQLFQAFVAGSKCDPYVTAAVGEKYTCHPNGWGYALYDGENLQHFRSSRPVWLDDVRLPRIAGKYLQAMFHSRLASNPALDSPICSHPFVVATDREVLLLGHNGGVEADLPAGSRVVDTEWALDEIVKAGGLVPALPLLKDRTRPNSALNLMVLSIPRDKKLSPAVYCLNFFKSNDPGRVAYYNMYTADYNGGKVFLSSTYKDLGIPGLTNFQLAPFGELFNLGGDSRDLPVDIQPAEVQAQAAT